MRKFLKITLLVLAILATFIAGGLAYFNTNYPKTAPAPQVTVTSNVKRLARGAYLANNVAACIGCHSSRDWSKLAAPPIAGTEGGGGDKFDRSGGLPGTITVSNITPAALGHYSDGALIRAIACGVTKEQRALFPVMPYANYNYLSKEDMYSIVVYLRTIQPIQHLTPPPELDFPVNLIVKTMPLRHYMPGEEIKRSDTVRYGKYLVTIASCHVCHTQMNKGKFVEGMDYAGGKEFHIRGGVVRSANITPDPKTGIGAWSKEMFISRFKSYPANVPAGAHEFNTPMPWTEYAGMTTEDLSAIYAYLKTIKPVSKQVERWTPTP